MLSLGVLSYSLTPHHEALTQNALLSYAGQADELVVVENGGSVDWVADIFIKFAENQGYTKGINAILKNATKDYIALVSNDTRLLAGNLRDLCVENTVTYPKLDTLDIKGAFFVVPRSVMEKVGILDEGMKLRYSDTEYFDRLAQYGVPVKQIDSVLVHHDIDQTIHLTLDQAQGDREYYGSLK